MQRREDGQRKGNRKDKGTSGALAVQLSSTGAGTRVCAHRGNGAGRCVCAHSGTGAGTRVCTHTFEGFQLSKTMMDVQNSRRSLSAATNPKQPHLGQVRGTKSFKTSCESREES